MSKPNPSTILLQLVLVLFMMVDFAVAQQHTGKLLGTVVDERGRVQAGVLITLSGIGAPRSQPTNAAGCYRFLGLSPGNYILTAQLEGFSTVEYTNLAVAVGRTTTLDVTILPGFEETLTVTAVAPLIEARNPSGDANVSSRELEQIPTARDPWSLLSQAPAVVVDRVNVGGNESGQQSLFLGAGATHSDNLFAVDGVLLTDMAWPGASLTYYDFGAFEEIQLTISSVDVTTVASGVTINQVTKRGGNRWRGTARYLRTDGELQSTPSRLPDGRRGNRIDVVEEYGLDIGGPLWREHMWMWTAYGKSDIGNVTLGGQIDRTRLNEFNSKINFQATSSNSGIFHFRTNDKIKNGRGAGPQRTSETTHDQITPADMWKLEDTLVLGSNTFLTGLWSSYDGIFIAAPKGGLDADAFWDSDGVLHGSYWDYTRHLILDQARLAGRHFFHTGSLSHELVLGGSIREQEASATKRWPRGKIVYSCELMGCSQVAPNVAYVRLWRDAALINKITHDAIWAQDTMQGERWTFNFGLRYDRQDVDNLPATSPANPARPDLLPELTFEGNDGGGFEWRSLHPRIGITYALGPERDTLLRAGFSRYVEQLGEAPGARGNPVGGVAYIDFFFADVNHNQILDLGELESLNAVEYLNVDRDDPSAFVAANVTDPGFKPEITNELTASIEHAFTAHFVASATLRHRNISHIPEARLLIKDEGGGVRVAMREDWVPDTPACSSPENPCELPDGSVVSNVPVYSLRPELTPTGGRLLSDGDREQDYFGLTLSLTKRLSKRWRLAGHFTWNDWSWDIGPGFWRFDDPTDTTVDNDELALSDGNGVVAQRSSGSGDKADVWIGSRWSFSVNGLLQVVPQKPWGFNLAAVVTGREGFVSPPYVSVTGPGRRVQLAAIDSFRNEDVILFDLRFEKKMQLGEMGLTLSLDGFNLLDARPVLQRQRNVLAGTSNDVREVLSPRVFRLGFKLSFH